MQKAMDVALIGAVILCVGTTVLVKGITLMPSAKMLVQNEQLRVEAECDRGTKKACAYLAQVERSKQ